LAVLVASGWLCCLAAGEAAAPRKAPAAAAPKAAAPAKVPAAAAPKADDAAAKKKADDAAAKKKADDAAAAKRKPYKMWPYDPTLRKREPEIRGILRARRFDGKEQLFEEFYRKYSFAQWSQPENHPKLALLRQRLRNDFSSVRQGPVHSRLRALSLEILTATANEDYHPAVRYNSMLMIGDLNATESPALNQPAVPLPATLPILRNALDDPTQIDPVKLAALLGIIRHIKQGTLSQDVRNQLVADMLKRAESKSQKGRSAEVQAWYRARAVDALGALGAIGSGDAVVNALVEIVVDSDSPVSTRCTAAQALGQLNYQGAQDLNPSALAVSLGKLAVDACNRELAVVEEKRKEKEEQEKKSKSRYGPMPGGMPGGPAGMGPGAMPGGPAGMGPGAMPGGFGMAAWGKEEKEPEESLSRPRLKYCLNSALIGLTGGAEGQEPLKGVGSLAGEEPYKTFVDSLRQRLQTMSDLVSYIKLTPTDANLSAREIRELEDREREKLEAQVRVKKIEENLTKLEDELAKKPE